jgi:small GTP-binding protein
LTISSKVVVIGDERVGKTSISNRYCHNLFSENQPISLAVSCYKKDVFVDPSESVLCKLCIWDTCGQERYKSLNSAYYRGSDGALIVYDISQAAELS